MNYKHPNLFVMIPYEERNRVSGYFDLSVVGEEYAKLLGDLTDELSTYDSRQKPSIRPKIREPTPEQKYQQEENHCYKVLSDYFHLLRKWEKQYAPQRTDEVWHPLFVEALQKKSYIEYLLDILLYDTPEEKKALVAEQRKEVMKLEQRIAGHTAEHDRGRSQRKSGLDR